MSESIESFVERLHEQGIDAGRREAERIKTEAQAHADALIKIAEERAEQIVERAEEERRKIQRQLDAELRLAARDAVLSLQSTLDHAVRNILAEKTAAVLEDPEFVRSLIREVLRAYARGDTAAISTLEINISPDMLERLKNGVLHELKSGTEPSVTWRGNLAELGFEYRIGDAIHEVTVQSVVEVLANMVSPGMRSVLEQALKAQNDNHIPDYVRHARAELPST